MTVGGEKIDGRRSHVEREHAEALDRIDEEEDAAFPAYAADRLEVIAEAAGELDEAQAHDPGARIDRGTKIVDGDAAAATGNRAHLDAAVGLIHPWVLVRRVLLGGNDDVVALLPWKTLGDETD